jgi:hypothetical protein
MNRTGSCALWLLAAGSWLGCSNEVERGSSESAPVSPDLVSSTEGPGADGDGDVSPEVALPGPGNAHPTGGQSGTDAGDGVSSCSRIVPMPLASDAVQAGERVSWRMRNTLRRHILTGSLLGEPVTLEVELEQSGVPMHRVNDICNVVEVPVRMSVMTVPATGSDVLSVERREGLLTLRQNHGYVEMRLQEADFSNPERLRAALLGQNARPAEDVYIYGYVVVYFEFAALARDELTPNSASLYYSGSLASFNGGFDEPFSPAPPPSAPPAAECASAEATQAVVFESQEAALSQLVGVWALCNGGPYPGVQIFPDGTWQAILPGSVPRLGSGFEREGVVTFKEHLEYGEGGARLPVQRPQLEFELSPAWSWTTSEGSSAARGGVLDVSASGNTVASGLLVRLATPIEPAVAPLFGRAERAGAAGCASTETEIEAPATSEGELLEKLRGRWVGCAGFSGELYFDGEGNLQIAGERYHDLTEHLLVQPRSDGSYGIATSTQALNVVFSAHPLKLQITDVNVGQPLVFSAAP